MCLVLRWHCFPCVGAWFCLLVLPESSASGGVLYFTIMDNSADERTCMSSLEAKAVTRAHYIAVISLYYVLFLRVWGRDYVICSRGVSFDVLDVGLVWHLWCSGAMTALKKDQVLKLVIDHHYSDVRSLCCLSRVNKSWHKITENDDSICEIVDLGHFTPGLRALGGGDMFDAVVTRFALKSGTLFLFFYFLWHFCRDFLSTFLCLFETYFYVSVLYIYKTKRVLFRLGWRDVYIQKPSNLFPKGCLQAKGWDLVLGW